MSCMLTVLGEGLDVDAFVERTGIAGFRRRYKGDVVSASRNTRLAYSYASLRISNAGFEEPALQIAEAEAFLRDHRQQLACIATTEGVDFATINFGAESTMEAAKPLQSFYFPPALVALCAELTLGVELTVYDF